MRRGFVGVGVNHNGSVDIDRALWQRPKPVGRPVANAVWCVAFLALALLCLGARSHWPSSSLGEGGDGVDIDLAHLVLSAAALLLGVCSVLSCWSPSCCCGGGGGASTATREQDLSHLTSEQRALLGLPPAWGNNGGGGGDNAGNAGVHHSRHMQSGTFGSASRTGRAYGQGSLRSPGASGSGRAHVHRSGGRSGGRSWERILLWGVGRAKRVRGGAQPDETCQVECDCVCVCVCVKGEENVLPCRAVIFLPHILSS